MDVYVHIQMRTEGAYEHGVVRGPGSGGRERQRPRARTIANTFTYTYMRMYIRARVGAVSREKDAAVAAGYLSLPALRRMLALAAARGC